MSLLVFFTVTFILVDQTFRNTLAKKFHFILQSSLEKKFVRFRVQHTVVTALSGISIVLLKFVALGRQKSLKQQKLTSLIDRRSI